MKSINEMEILQKTHSNTNTLLLDKADIEEFFNEEFDIVHVDYTNNGFPLYSKKITSSQELKKCIHNTTEFFNCVVSVELKQKETGEIIDFFFDIESKQLVSGGNLRSHMKNSKYVSSKIIDGFKQNKINNIKLSWDDFAAALKININWDITDLEVGQKKNKLQKFGHFIKNIRNNRLSGKYKK